MEQITAPVELLLLAILVAVACKRIAVPYTSALVACGLLVAFSGAMPIRLDRDVLLFVFLPPLLFQGALDMDLEHLRREWLPVVLYATAGTAISALVIGGVIWWALPGALGPGTGFLTALFLGTILSATDPVSVLATFRSYAVDKRLTTLLEGESVFNDGIAVILYLVLFDAVVPGRAIPSLGSAALRLLAVAGGAVIVGVATGWIVYRVLKRIDDHLLEVMVSVVLAWGSYLLAERLGTSGVLACACAGLVIGNYGRLFSMSPAARVTLTAFWEVAAFITNSFVFILIGMQLNQASLIAHVPLMLVTVAAMLVSRCVAIYGLALAMRFLGRDIPVAWQHALVVGGLRGSIPVALALGLGTQVPGHEAILAAVLGAVSFSLLVQALMVRPALAPLGLLPMATQQLELEVQTAREIGLEAALRELAALEAEGLSPALCERLSKRLLHARRAAVEEAHRRGLISQQAFDESRLEIDLRLAELQERKTP